MTTINFKLSDNRQEALNILEAKGYTKIGHIKPDCVGYCIMINRKQYFEISNMLNPNIKTTSNISDVSFYCI